MSESDDKITMVIVLNRKNLMYVNLSEIAALYEE